ncbi:MAG: patatin-like phospholipase family protein [Deltaproteobacteria bacterium]|nr:patatin-like phospholipase family protein [Deltaproteobacteria bacterium]
MTDIFYKNSRVPPGKLGLALGSGSARGWAHIGVIRALIEAGIRIDYVAGTSIGALVGAIYASGNIESLEEIVLQLDWKQIASFLDVVFPKSGLIDGNRISEFIRIHVGAKNIEDLPLPFCAVSTDLATGNEVVIKDGDIIEAVRASISVPGIFTPVRKGDMILIDGSLVNPVPVSVVREMGADLVIAVDLNHDIVEKKGISKTRIPNSGALASGIGTSQRLTKRSKILDALNKRLETLNLPALAHIRQWMSRDPMPNIFEVIISSINIMQAQITATRLKTDRPDVLIQPHLGHIRFLEFNRAREVIAEGYREAKACISAKFG